MNQMFAPPEEGQTVKVRHKIWEVKSVNKSKASKQESIHRVGIECISDESLGREIEVVWESEIAPVTFEKISLPEMDGIDTPEMFDSFIKSLKWSSNSVATEDAFYAPFKSSVKIEDFQHIPLMRSRSMPLVRMLIADDVGFGKTIEAGLILQEMIQSHRASSVLVICPAHLQTKWEEEMADKFGLEFKIINRESILKMRKDFGTGINPWASFPRIITSLDYAKKEHPKRLIDELAEIKKKDNPRKKPWDVLILDEAHNVAPSGQKAYVRDSDKTKLLKSISRYFEHRLFLTATPHNGYRESFTALLELLDELRFSRGSELDPKHRKAVTVRRLKDDIKKPDGSRHFPLRILKPRDEKLDPEFYLELSSQEQELFDLLEKYSERRLEKLNKKTRSATNFVLKILKKRALSSMRSIRKSLAVHLNHFGKDTFTQESEIIINNRIRKEDEDFDNDEEKDLAQEEALQSSASVLSPLDEDESEWLNRMAKIADDYDDGDNKIIADTKLSALIKWINNNLRTNNEWNKERLIIFTEYRDTKDYIFDVLEAHGYGEALQMIYGGMTEKDRKEINKIFQSPPSEHPARILIATDAASEGADFQLYCRNLIHYEIPWNPIRLEQRNGRIDRYGQKAPEVYIHHFIYRNNRDSEFLNRIIDKIDLIRKDLGSVSKVISKSIDKHLAGEEVNLDNLDNEQRLQIAMEDLEEDQTEIEDAKEIKESIEKNRKRFGITEEMQLNILKSALKLEGTNTSIEKKDHEIFTIKNIPISWSECRKFESNDYEEFLLTFYRERAEAEYGIVVLHLNHPLMQRALKIFRAQMWKSSNLERNAIKRVTIEKSNIVQKPLVIGWGRNRILGKKNNLLHDDLFRVGAYLNNDSLDVLDEEKIDEILNTKRFEYDSDISIIQEKITPRIKDLEQIIFEKGKEKFPELESEIMKRGEKFEAQARALINEQINQIRKKLNQWDKDQSSTQLKFDFGEEWEDKVSDMNSLKIRLDELFEERKTEPQRLKEENAVLSNRTYPIAYQLIVPSS